MSRHSTRISELSNEFGKEKPVLFLHIPKTAGTTLNRLIARNYRASNSYRFYTNDVFSPQFQFKETITGKSIISGHYLFGLHDKLGVEPVYITFLRDPAARIWSTWHYIRRHKNHPDYALFHSMQFEEFMEHEAYRKLCNMQARFIAGDTSLQDISQMIEKAMHHIEKYFLLVGLTEEFDRSLYLLAHMLNWKHRLYRPVNVNPAKSQSDMPDEIRSRLENDNQADSILHHRCRERLDTIFSSVHPVHFLIHQWGCKVFRLWKASK